MSADNAVIVLRTWSNKVSCGEGCFQNVEPYEVFRVFHTQSWDNFYWFEKYQPYNVGAYLLNETKGCKEKYTDYIEASRVARALQKEIGYVEYGIQYVETDYYLLCD